MLSDSSNSPSVFGSSQTKLMPSDPLVIVPSPTQDNRQVFRMSSRASRNIAPTPQDQQNFYLKPSLVDTEPLKLGDLMLYPDQYKVERNGKSIPLRKKEYQLLEFLAINKNKVINRNTILEYVWDYNVHSVTNTLEVHISSLRRKIDGDATHKMLRTFYGLGYKLQIEQTDLPLPVQKNAMPENNCPSLESGVKRKSVSSAKFATANTALP